MPRVLLYLSKGPERNLDREEAREMEELVHPYMRRLAKPLAFGLTLFALSFLLQLAPHSHATGHEEAACSLCQVAHIGVAPAVALASLCVPLVSFGSIASFAEVSLSEFSFEYSPSRAPPFLTS
jgi:hypothetical protein